MDKLEELLYIFKEIDNNLKNNMIRTRIKRENQDFEYDKFIDVIKSYIDNFQLLKETSEDQLVSNIMTKAKAILSATNNSIFDVHTFTNNGLYLIKYSPNPIKEKIHLNNEIKTPKINSSKTHSWDEFISNINFDKLKKIKKNLKDNNYEEGEKVRVFLKKFAPYLQHKIPELESYKWKLNQASTQPQWTGDNGFRLSFYKGDSLPKSTQINITFWSSWHGGIFIKDNENIIFSRDDVVKNLQEKYPNIEFVKDKQHIMAIHFKNGMPSENEVIDAIRKLLNILDSIQSKQTESVEDIVDAKKRKNIVIPEEVSIKKKSEIKSVLGVESLADTLASVIIKDFDEAGMMVGIFGKWGRGKTHFAEKLWDSIKEKKINYNRVVFSAWKYQDTKASWAYLYENIFSAYLDDVKDEDKANNFYIEKKKIWNINIQKYSWTPIIIYVILFVFALIWSFFIDKIELASFLISTFGIILLIKFFLFYLAQKSSAITLYDKYFSKNNFSDYLGLQAEIENELTILLKTWIPNSDEDKKIVLFVDDIDRCNIEQVIDIVDGLRVILDNPEIHSRLIIVTAIDETILEQALKHKYENTDNITAMYKEYLEKIFIIGLKLNRLNDNETEEIFHTILPDIDEVIVAINKSNDEQNITNSDNKISDNIVSDESDDKIIETENNNKISEINIHEKQYLLEVIKKLDNVTPRKIRIFYYKYLIMKILFDIRVKEKGLMPYWNQEENEKVIIDVLIHLANNKKSDNFEFSGDDKIRKDLIYVAKMVSVL